MLGTRSFEPFTDFVTTKESAAVSVFCINVLLTSILSYAACVCYRLLLLLDILVVSTFKSKSRRSPRQPPSPFEFVYHSLLTSSAGLDIRLTFLLNLSPYLNILMNFVRSAESYDHGHIHFSRLPVSEPEGYVRESSVPTCSITDFIGSSGCFPYLRRGWVPRWRRR